MMNDRRLIPFVSGGPSGPLLPWALALVLLGLVAGSAQAAGKFLLGTPEAEEALAFDPYAFESPVAVPLGAGEVLAEEPAPLPDDPPAAPEDASPAFAGEGGAGLPFPPIWGPWVPPPGDVLWPRKPPRASPHM